MQVVKTIKELRNIIDQWKSVGLTIGLVPTMGFLHEGHGSLIKTASQNNDKVVVSIFVNPTQFGPNEDLDKYPRDLEHDKAICKANGASIIFHPEVEELYPSPSFTSVCVNGLSEKLCGEKRPGHFNGVCLVVSKLFNIVKPHKAYFGEKDAQQLAVIKRMVYDLNFNIKIVGCPIVREEDGLAMSSRNAYLSYEERKAALILSKSLNKAKKLLNSGERDATKIKEFLVSEISEESLAKIDYIEIVDSSTIQPVEKIESTILVAIAVFIGKTRLIDNFTCEI